MDRVAVAAAIRPRPKSRKALSPCRTPTAQTPNDTNASTHWKTTSRKTNNAARTPPSILAKNETISSSSPTRAAAIAPKLCMAKPTSPVDPPFSSTLLVKSLPSSTYLPRPNTPSAMNEAWSATITGIR